MEGQKIDRVSKSKKAEIIFPVARIDRFIRKNRVADRVSPEASVYLSAVLEYLIAEILDLSGYETVLSGKKRINPVFIEMAVKNDDELNRVLANTQLTGYRNRFELSVKKSEGFRDLANPQIKGECQR